MLTAPRKQGKLIKISCRAAPEFEYYFIFGFFSGHTYSDVCVISSRDKNEINWGLCRCVRVRLPLFCICVGINRSRHAKKKINRLPSSHCHSVGSGSFYRAVVSRDLNCIKQIIKYSRESLAISFKIQLSNLFNSAISFTILYQN